MDLGVSSPQLDDAARGFSFMHNGPLDMRMDQSQTLDAKEIVNKYDESDLINIFRKTRNKKFRYSPRYSKSQKPNLYGFDSAYAKHRESNSVFDKSNAWDEARLRSRNRSNSLFSKTILFIVILLTLIFLYIIDFDLSIFLK